MGHETAKGTKPRNRRVFETFALLRGFAIQSLRDANSLPQRNLW